MANRHQFTETIENTTGEDIFFFDGAFRLGPGGKVFAGTNVEGPSFVDAGARVLRDVSIGAYSYVGRDCIVVNAEIGRYCAIGHECRINHFRGHPKDWLSVHPFQYDSSLFNFWPTYANFNKREFNAEHSQARITIGPDVWIGAGVSILGGVTIGAGAILGANSLVNHDVDPYGIALGTPARVKRHRFPPEIVSALLNVRWWDLSEEALRNLPFDDIRACIDILSANR